jgi:hypothetical protein
MDDTSRIKGEGVSQLMIEYKGDTLSKIRKMDEKDKAELRLALTSINKVFGVVTVISVTAEDTEEDMPVASGSTGAAKTRPRVFKSLFPQVARMREERENSPLKTRA